MSDPAVSESVVIGVSFDLPDDVGEQVRAARHRADDPLAGVVRPHVTLLPPTSVPVRALPRVTDHLSRVFSRTAPFPVTLRGTASFRPVSPVVFLVVAEGARRCSTVAAEVRSGPVAVSLAFPYHPHVTLAQNVTDAALDAVAEEFAQVERRFMVACARMDVQREDGTWAAHSAYEFTGGDGGSRGRGLPRRGSRRR